METTAAGTEKLATTEVDTVQLILAATDGTEQSAGAVGVACSLAGAMGSIIQVVAVQRPLALVVPDAPLLLERDVTTRLTAGLKDRVRCQCAAIAGERGRPELPEPEVFTGEPERVIARVATEKNAHIIVVGIGRHNVVDRIFGSETALKVARSSHVPVLAVPPELRSVPHRAVVGVDFSEASLHAARGAVNLLVEGGVMHLVHVIPRERLLLDPWISDREYDDLVRHRFVRFRAQLALPPNVTLEEHTCSGDPARELISYAERQHADLIAAGSHGHGRVARLVLGSVTTALLRAATSAVLVVPPESQSTEAASLEGDGTVHAERSQWSAILAEFTRTNAGRRTRLEVDDPELGAQAQEIDYPLRGVAFDPHDQRIEIMLGALGQGEAHLSRSLGDVSSLDLLADEDGKDTALRVRHGAGQTLLTFTSP